VRRPRVKICGLTRPGDARLCYLAGADFLGVIFAASPRQVSVSEARAIREAVPDAQLVGVFTEGHAEDIAAVTERVGLDLIQLHESDSPERWLAVHRAAGVPVLPALTGDQVREPAVAHAVRSDPHVACLLLDLPKQGPSTDGARDRLWTTARHCRTDGLRIVLAGALDAAVVPEALAVARPYGLDVSRGVESAPGIKDPARVRRFLAAVHEAEVIGAC
jgi:phosphoribosylanthranilate isomerase